MEIKCSYSKIVPVSQLVPNPKNTNQHPEKQLRLLSKILQYQGWRHPIVVSNLSGYIVAGHGRLDAAKMAGFEEVPVDYQGFENAAQEMAFLESDNLVADLAEHDHSMMLDNIRDLDLGDDFDLELFGLPDLILPDLQELDEDKEDDVPENVETRCKPGDLWKLGSHKLLCGDATNMQHAEKLMGDEKAAMILTDPPYNVAYSDSAGKTIQNDSMKDEDFRQFLTDAFTSYEAVTLEGAAFYVFHADSEGYNFRGSLIDSGFMVKQCCIWVKDQMVMGRQDYHWKHEPCLYGWKPGAAHSWHTDRKQTTIWNFDRPKRGGAHPTMKPIELLQYPISNSSSVGSLVVDFFGGSGSTMIACEKTNRKCYMMELDPKYADVILTRWEEYTGKTAELVVQ